MARRRILWATTVLVAVVCSPGITIGAAADDQARLDEAIDGFNERMIAAGWVSEGPSDDADEGDDDQDDGDDVDGDNVGDDAFAECLGELGVVFEDLDASELPGQVAESSSDKFSYTAPADGAATTEAFSFDATEESAAAFAASVDDVTVATVAEFIDLMGAKSTGDCLLEAFEADMAAEEDDSDVPVEFEISVSNEANLGIGERSVALGYEVSAVFIVPIEFDVEILLAQTGHDLAAVFHAVTGERASDFDPAAHRGPPGRQRAPLASPSRRRG